MKYILIIMLGFVLRSETCPQKYILISGPAPISGCGGFLFAGQFLFIDAKDSSQFIGVIKCPDSYGDKFFKEDEKYHIEFSKDTVLGKEYSWINVFDYPIERRPPIKIIEKITKAKY